MRPSCWGPRSRQGSWFARSEPMDAPMAWSRCNGELQLLRTVPLASNYYRRLAENSCWCFPRNRQRAVIPERPQARTNAIVPKQPCFTERSRNTGRRSRRSWKRPAATCLASCSTSSRRTFAVAFPRTASFAFGAKTVGTAESSLSRANGVDFAQVAWAVAWPTRRHFVWSISFPKCLLGNTCSPYPMPCASRWPIRPTLRAWCWAHSSAPSTPTFAAAHGNASCTAGYRLEA